jgi:predicted ATPase/class 3 adenylate cyclase
MRQLVPAFILDKFDAGEQRGKITAAAMFVDFSGFSAMSDTLEKHMRHGSDELLASIMEDIFKPLVYNVYAQGGFVVGYAGDAMTAIFVDNGDASHVLRCASAATEIEKHFASNSTQTTQFGDFNISVKIGLSLGEAIWEIFRSADKSRATFSFRGPAMDGSARAEHRAKPGEVWMDSSFYESVKQRVRGLQVDDLFRLTEMDSPLDEMAIPDVAASPSNRHMTAFFSEAIISTTFRGEFRPLVNVFMDIPPKIQEGDQLQGFMQAVFVLQKKYGGFFIRPDFGDKGINLFIIWGAPIAYENDIERALNFLLDLKKETGIPFTAGVSYRLEYAGFFGSFLREDYTGYGWGISLAARMMKFAAPGEIWIDDEVAQRIKQNFHFGEQQEGQFKGFAEKQKIYLLLNRKDVAEQVFRGDFEGREKELAELNEFVKPLWRGEFAGIMLIKGEAGVGKSRLIFEFTESETFANDRVMKAVCQTDEIIRQSFNPFRYWLKSRFGISNTDSEEENQRKFLKEISRLASVTPDNELWEELQRTHSFLGTLLNLHLEDALYEQLDAKGRHENTLIALSVFLRCESLQKPLILILEDAHWLDDESRAFFPDLIRTLVADESKRYPIATLATSRMEGSGFPISGNIAIREMTLGGLDQKALSRLAEEWLGKPVSPELIDFLNKRAEGNPFFVEQILRYLIEGNLLELKNAVFNIANTNQVSLLSADIQSILIARLDRLAQDVKDVVQSASVLGREFEIQLLINMLNDSFLPDKVDQAESAEIWLPMSEIRYIFRHALMRDAAYSMQLRSRQQQLHALALDAIETLYADELIHHYGELSHHAERANNTDKARKYLELAAAEARQTYQLSQALNYINRALALTPQEDLEKQFDLLNARISVYSQRGEMDLRWNDILKMSDLAESIGKAHHKVTVFIQRANHYHSEGNWQKIVDMADEGIDITRAAGDITLELDFYQSLTQALSRLGRLDEAISLAKSALEIAGNATEESMRIQILNGLGMFALERLEVADANSYFGESLRIAREVGNIHVEAQVLNNLGNLAAQTADYVIARDYFIQAYELARKIGNRPGQGLVLGNLGWISGLLGDFKSAREYHTQALAISREVGNQFHVTNTFINLSAVAGYEGDAKLSITNGEQGLALARTLGDKIAEAWAQLYLGFAWHLQGDFDKAAEAFSESVKIREELNQPAYQIEPIAGLALTAFSQNRPDSAIAHVETILTYLSNGGTLEGAEEPLRIYLTCYQILHSMQDPRAAEVIRNGYGFLTNSLAKIEDENTRRMVVDNVTWRRAVNEIGKNLK